METTTLSNITNEIITIISKNNSSIPKITEEQRINAFLDSINRLKKRLITRNNKINELEKLYVKITWQDITNNTEQELLDKVIESSENFIKKSFVNVAKLRRNFWKDNICRLEIKQYQTELENLEDTVGEVKQIFSLRKDEDYLNLLNDLD